MSPDLPTAASVPDRNTVPQRPEKESLPQTPAGIRGRINTFFHKTDRKKLLLLGITLLLIISIVGILFIPVQKNEDEVGSMITVTPKAERTGQGGEKAAVFNPLIDSSEINRVEKNYHKTLQENGGAVSPPVEYHFNYKLSPSLRTKQSLRLIESVLAASSCSTTKAPDKIPVYGLKSKIKDADAQKIAASFGITTEPQVLGSADGSDSKYYFSDKESTKYFTLTEPSGFYYYHQAEASTSAGNALTTEQAKKLVTDMLKKHDLLDNTVLDAEESVNAANLDYIFSYRKEIHPFPTVDTAAITALGKDISLCDLKPSTFVNLIQAAVTEKGHISKLTNNSRMIASSDTVASQTLDAAMTEYKDTPPIDPIIIGNGAIVDGETVTVTESTLVWYDYGELYAQGTYVPMYLTSGTSASGNRVITLFPAVGEDTLKASKVSGYLPDSGAVPANHLSNFVPKQKAATAVGGAARNLCYGSMIDYVVTCVSDDSMTEPGQGYTKVLFPGTGTVCYAAGSESTSSDDPLNICSEGIKSVTDTVTVIEGEDACTTMARKQQIPTGWMNTGWGSLGMATRKELSPGTKVTCTLSANPC